MGNKKLKEITFDIMMYGQIIRELLRFEQYDDMLNFAKRAQERIDDLISELQPENQGLEFDAGYQEWLADIHHRAFEKMRKENK